MDLTYVFEDPSLELSDALGFVSGPGGAPLGQVLITRDIKGWIAEGAELAAEWAKSGNPSMNPDAGFLAFVLNEHSRSSNGRQTWATNFGTLMIFTAPTANEAARTIAARSGSALRELLSDAGIQPDQ